MAHRFRGNCSLHSGWVKQCSSVPVLGRQQVDPVLLGTWRTPRPDDSEVFLFYRCSRLSQYTTEVCEVVGSRTKISHTHAHTYPDLLCKHQQRNSGFIPACGINQQNHDLRCRGCVAGSACLPAPEFLSVPALRTFSSVNYSSAISQLCL